MPLPPLSIVTANRHLTMSYDELRDAYREAAAAYDAARAENHNRVVAFDRLLVAELALSAAAPAVMLDLRHRMTGTSAPSIMIWRSAISVSQPHTPTLACPAFQRG